MKPDTDYSGEQSSKELLAGIANELSKLNGILENNLTKVDIATPDLDPIKNPKDTVATLEQARDFFIENSSGSVLCVYYDKKKICTSYLEAEEFFKGSAQ